MDRQQQLKNCSSVRTILMLFIVLHHSLIMFPGVLENLNICTKITGYPIINYLQSWMNTWHIYAFTLVSGYIFYYIKYEKNGYQEYLPFIINKIKRLVVPYVFMVFLWALPIWMFVQGKAEICYKFLLGIEPEQYWYILTLFFVFLVFWLISDFVDKKPIWGGLLCCLCYVAYITLLNKYNYYNFGSAIQYMIYFYAGFMIRKSDAIDNILSKVPYIVWIVTSLIIFSSIKYFTDYSGFIFKIIRTGLYFSLYLIGAVGAFYVLQKLINKYLINSKVINYYNQYSMSVYLIHQQLIYFTTIWFNGIVHPLFLVIINFVFSLGVSTLISVFMNKHKVTRFILGGK